MNHTKGFNDSRPFRELSANTFVAMRRSPAVVDLQHGEYVAYEGREYRVGTVVSYAIERGECPVTAVQNALAAGHELWWLNPAPVIISNPPATPNTIAAKIEDSQVIRVEGRFLMISPAPNRNVKLVPLTSAELATVFDFDMVTVP